MNPLSEIFVKRIVLVRIKSFLSVPVFSELLRNRIFSTVIVIVACVQTGLVALGLKGWPCPFRAAFGLPCPGCGLSTALSHFLKGNWVEALHAHAFAPVILMGFILMAVVCLLPEKYYSSVVQKIEIFEKASGFLPILLIAMLLYWSVRLFYLI